MVAVKLWDNKAIDTSSDKIKEDVSKGVTNYILNHWNECVKITMKELLIVSLKLNFVSVYKYICLPYGKCHMFVDQSLKMFESQMVFAERII